MTSEQIPTPSSPSSRTGWLKIAALVLVSAVAGAGVSQAARYWGGHHGMGHGFMSGRMDPADIDRRVDKMSGYFAKEVNATDDQRSKLAVIAKAAAKDMLPMRETIRDARKQARALLSQPVIDKSAVETLRAAQIANADALSKRLSAAVTEAAEVLTPEQRKQLSERMAKHEGWLDGGDRG